MTHSSLRLAVSALLLVACATGNGGGDSSTGTRDGGQDDDDAGRRRDGGGTTTCSAGQHRCGGGCIDDLDNLPENGCRYGCGEPCPTPPDGEAACDGAGACTIGCEPPFHLEGTECVCTPNACEDIGYTCGAPDDGCGTPLDCGACDGDGVCMEGTCSCPEDAREPNDSRLGAVMIASFTDSPASNVVYSDFSLDSEDDEDWFRIAVTDELDCCSSTNPDITVTLDDIPAGSDYELAAWFTCGTGTDDTSCSIGQECEGSASGTTSETISFTTECGNTTDEHGTLWIRVTSARWGGSCAPYSLEVTVD